MPFHFSFPDCYVRFWSTWDTQQSLSLSIDAFVERYSLSTNGRVWQHMVQSRKPQLDQNIQTFHIQSSQRSHNQLRYRWYESTCPCSALFRAYTWGCTLCSSWHTTDSSCYSTISEPSPSSEPRIAISISEYRGLCHTLQALTTSQSVLTQQMTALRAHQEQIITTQTQHTAILRQIQHYLGILSAPEHPIPILSEPTKPS